MTVVIPGDLHLTRRDLDNHRAAAWMVNQVNDWIRPDFVQFIGDNVQRAEEHEFELFADLRKGLTVPSYALVGDHDVDAGSSTRSVGFSPRPQVGDHHVGADSSTERFRRYVGETH